MSGGRVHDGATIVGAIAVGSFLHSSPLTQSYALMTAIGVMVGGCLLSPDMDVSAPRGSKSLNRWRLKLGWLKLDLRWLWKPYQKIAPHRSWVSHSPLVGSLGRVLYLSVITFGFFPVLVVAGVGLPSAIALLVGNEIGSGLHLLADGLHWAFYLIAVIICVLTIKFLEMGWTLAS